jgi:hypothetical protein
MIKSRRITWVRYVARMKQVRNVYTILDGKPEGKRPLVIYRRWENNIKINL